MDEMKILQGRNLLNTKVPNATTTLSDMWNKASEALYKEDGYEQAREMILDAGAQVNTYLGELVQGLDEIYKDRHFGFKVGDFITTYDDFTGFHCGTIVEFQPAKVGEGEVVILRNPQNELRSVWVRELRNWQKSDNLNKK